MTIVVPNRGAAHALENFVNKAAAQNPVLRLFKNNITPAETDTDSTYTECDLTGYSAITLTGSSWGSASVADPASIAYAQQTFTFTGGFGQTVYGYYVTQVTSGDIMWSERDGSPFTPATSGDNIKITPTLTAD